MTITIGPSPPRPYMGIHMVREIALSALGITTVIFIIVILVVWQMIKRRGIQES
jgi:hypothetical protein